VKASIQVKSKAEGKAIARGLEDPVVRATVAVVGHVLDVPSHLRARVLRNVTEAIEDAEDSEGGAA
jgi:hypothetical protein